MVRVGIGFLNVLLLPYVFSLSLCFREGLSMLLSLPQTVDFCCLLLNTYLLSDACREGGEGGERPEELSFCFSLSLRLFISGLRGVVFLSDSEPHLEVGDLY